MMNFYMSVHARNTKRLPYNIELVVGRVVLDKDELDLDQAKIFKYQRYADRVTVPVTPVSPSTVKLSPSS